MTFSLESLQQALSSVWFALVAGLLIQLTATQWLKMCLPVKWSDARRTGATNAIAFLTGAIPTASILYELDAAQHLFWLAIVIGFAGPLLYKTAVALIGQRWENVAKAMSAHTGALRKRNGVK